MRALVVIGALCSAVLSCAQDSTATRSKWRIGASGTYGMGYRTLVSDAQDASTQAFIDLRNDSELPAPYFGFGVDVTYDLHRQWSLASGLHYVSLGCSTQRKYFDFIAIDPIDPAIPESEVVNYHYQCFSMPFLIRYRIGKARLHFEPALGVSADLLHKVFTIKDRTYQDGRETHERNDLTDESYRMGMISALGELNLLYMIGARWEVRLAPQGRCQLLRDSHAAISEHLYGAGLALGCLFRL